MVAGGAGAAAWSGWLDLASPYRATHAARCVAAHPSYGAAHGATFRGVRWTRLVALPISTSLCLRAAYAENIVAAGRSLGAANVATSRLAWCTSRSAYSLPTCFSLRAANNAARWVARVALITAVSIPTSFSRPALLTAAAAVVFVFPKVLTGPAAAPRMLPIAPGATTTMQDRICVVASVSSLFANATLLFLAARCAARPTALLLEHIRTFAVATLLPRLAIARLAAWLPSARVCFRWSSKWSE